VTAIRKPFAITLDVGSSRANHTGAWRTERPGYVHNLPPCDNACPAGENIQQWLYDAEEGPAKYEAAWRQIMDDNPGGLDEFTALFEARRCMSCGNCFGCDNFYGVCPDNAIIKLGDSQYEIDYDYCKGCGLCAAECPCGAIQMQPEPT
jgi:2-oxoacid:acceptor oxidoreductase delta subunit (pyruvate/2-ketoisovalerate family)